MKKEKNNLKKCERCGKEYEPNFEPYIYEWKFCLECDGEAAKNFIKDGVYFYPKKSANQ